ncbi:MAG: group 1 truncated hemoglobin [Cytophagales bacterium]|nr:group 1 truncated hemoglobin [Cytophagales bacterium]
MILQDEKTLFEKIGGMHAVDAAVEIFYAKVLADDRISHFFRWTHMKTQTAKQKAFLAYAFGAPLKYSGKNMRDAHAHLLELGLNDSHFDAVVEHLISTLQDLDVTDELILEVNKIAESTRAHVLGL